MSTFAASLRTAYIHIGTHKTGTTSIQALLAANASTFSETGLLIPSTGRIDAASAGHHNIAWELTGYRDYDPRSGTFAALLHEISGSDALDVCLTSEEFEFCHADRAALCRLRDGLRGIGYEPRIICYLRPQADYLESLFAEICPVWNVGFTDFRDAILTDGIYGCSRFAYDRLLEPFAAVFGHERLMVRPYRASAPSEALLRDFAAVIAPHIPFDRLQLPQRLNAMRSFQTIVDARRRHLGCPSHHEPAAEQRFDPLALIDLARIAARFSQSNATLARTYGVRIAAVSAATWAREITAELFRSENARRRKHLIRALDRAVAEAA